MFTTCRRDWGRVHLTGELLGVRRGLDQIGDSMASGVPYVFGYEGTKLHGMLEGAWENQYDPPGRRSPRRPISALRLDAATYDRATAAIPPGALPEPADDVLFIGDADRGARSALAADGDSTAPTAHLFEPIAQIVYRGSAARPRSASPTTMRRASSSIRPTCSPTTASPASTGRRRAARQCRRPLPGQLRRWQLARPRRRPVLPSCGRQCAYGVSDQVQVGTSTGLGTTASFIVGERPRRHRRMASPAAPRCRSIRRRGRSPAPESVRITRRPGSGSRWAPTTSISPPIRRSASTTTSMRSRTCAASTIADYYTLSGGAAAGTSTTMPGRRPNTGVAYDDGYLALGGGVYFTPTSLGHLGLRRLNLKGPDWAARLLTYRISAAIFRDKAAGFPR